MNAFRLATLLAALVAWSSVAQAQFPSMSSPRRGKQEPPKQSGDVPPPKQEKIFPAKASWIAITLNGKSFTGERPSFILDEQFRMRGFSGCNTFSTTAYPLREQGIAVGPFALTKKACDKALMATERAFLVALRTAAKWDSDGKELIIKGPNGELKFERVL